MKYTLFANDYDDIVTYSTFDKRKLPYLAEYFRNDLYPHFDKFQCSLKNLIECDMLYYGLSYKHIYHNKSLSIVLEKIEDDDDKNWKLFLDDERIPVKNDYLIARSFYDAMDLIDTFGIPSHIAFDHDLGLGANGCDFAEWFANYIIDRDGLIWHELPKNFSYSVHSMNPIGANNIKNVMDAFLELYKETKRLYPEHGN